MTRLVAAMVSTGGCSALPLRIPNMRSSLSFQPSLGSGSIWLSSSLSEPPPPPNIMPPIPPALPAPGRDLPMASISSMNRMQAPCLRASLRALLYRLMTRSMSMPQNIPMMHGADM